MKQLMPICTTILSSHEFVQITSEYSKTCVKRSLKNRQKQHLTGKWKLNEGKKKLQNAPLGAFCNTLNLH